MGKEGVQSWGLNKNGRSRDTSSQVMSCPNSYGHPSFLCLTPSTSRNKTPETATQTWHHSQALEAEQ